MKGCMFSSKFAICGDIWKKWEAYLCIEIGNVQN
ncbi:hypothetical protein T03_12170 [Trichinella britovi]|uniref:Uncharacterized protein n=1 Tax=Trichinella britovi TaxID=45882 RepID=A0A0V0YYZ2_TRIBR|nr:hypothetical protein T03_12170 [Trichinella britovi]